MKAEIINQSLKTIVPEDLLHVILRLQDSRGFIDDYKGGLKSRREREEESQKWDRADEAIANINLAIVDLADLLSMELAGKILD